MFINDRSQGPLVSVVVPTCNSAKTLKLCLNSLVNQSYKHLELIVVDNFSKDRSVEIAKGFGAKVFIHGHERSAQKNYGALHANGEFIYFVDSDFVLKADVISKCVDACRFFDAVCTVNYSFGRSLWGKSIALKEYFLAKDPTIQVARFMKRSVFFDVGGFDEDLVVGEDLDLYARLVEQGYKIGFVSAVEWHIGEPETLKAVAMRGFYYGKNVKAYFRKRGGYAVNQLSPFKPKLMYKILRTGSPYMIGLALVDFVRWTSSALGIMCSHTRRA
ncbi:MAG: glycosyltransferase [Candidatus Nezhaarchaeales archaeon]